MLGGYPDVAPLEIKDDLDIARFGDSNDLLQSLDPRMAISLETCRLNFETGNQPADRLDQRTGKRGDRADPGFQVIGPLTQLVREPLEDWIQSDADRGLEHVDPGQQPVGGMRSGA